MISKQQPMKGDEMTDELQRRVEAAEAVIVDLGKENDALKAELAALKDENERLKIFEEAMEEIAQLYDEHKLIKPSDGAGVGE